MNKLKATRDAYGDALLELGALRDDILVLDADLSRSTRTEWFRECYPDRFINVGIAEQNLVGMAAGLAMAGFIPFATTYAIFVGRAYDQIRQAVAFGQANVKIVATHAGLAASHDGGSHQGNEDLALMRVLPGMTILSPADYHEAKQAVFAAASHPGPVYLRLQKEPVPIVTAPAQPFQIGRAQILRHGRDVALIATGSLLCQALEAAAKLANEGIESEVINVSTIKPLDVTTISGAIERCGCGVIIEEHSCIGGLYEAVAGAISARIPCRLASIGMADQFGSTGDWQELQAKFGLSSQTIAEIARQLVGVSNPPISG
ncbi:transketolase family protein [Chitiniphilus purpureus]|uniref:Transketolase family protein n=1 Tax=Chitiniphilus purpureus TaxID=2981137 RepID=A0ABY6DNA0_9NEIS|nr:transketolase C-terminal domain-containing protein [Chitiniphilus sp. CD1]UXY15802.1 transketolase family protein [Chitiniphilus sp. CD1]